MKCPACGHTESKVIDSRLTQGAAATRRRRVCEACKHRFTTYERVTRGAPTVVKRDGRREDFDRQKVLQSLEVAFKRREVPHERLEEIVTEIEQTIATAGAEVDSAEIGQEVLERLRKMDEVAYVRYASVHRDFRDVADFVHEVDRVTRARRAEASDRQIDLFEDPADPKK